MNKKKYLYFLILIILSIVVGYFLNSQIKYRFPQIYGEVIPIPLYEKENTFFIQEL